jgi:transposase-like protein
VVSHETVRRWVSHFGPAIAADLRKRRPKPHTIWHLDEVYLRIGGRFKSPGSAQRFLSVHAAVYNTFNFQRHLISRRTLRRFRANAMEQWQAATAAG